MPHPPNTLNQFESLIQVIADLRGPEGCPWDREQTHETLAPYAIEETHEMVEAIESKNDTHICEELGDVLFQVVLHAQLAKERSAFNIQDVIESITSKIVRRHPHVFADTQVNGIEDVFKNWDEIKKIENANKPQIKKSAIDVPPSLPALQRAHKIGEKTEKLKFDWQHASEVLTQLKAEIAELEEAMCESDSALKSEHLQHEMGDVLFSAAQLARHLQLEPESNLREANRRFCQRFDSMLTISGLSSAEFSALEAAKKELLWSQAKRATSVTK
ncbi:MAG: nucleoside triphosphate pyrophosphohydrolase [Bdellovibrionaceae bacterium]|nr:nucleoside triphosphate pyrophosphohydrolase [Bdellovibrio sp.]